MKESRDFSNEEVRQKMQAEEERRKGEAKKYGLSEDAELWQIHEKKEEIGEVPHILQLEEPATVLLESLRNKIENFTYDSILGDDIKARIHTLVLGKTIKEIYGKQKNLEIIFVQAGFLLRTDEEHTHEVKKYLERLRSRLGKRVLVLTEEIDTGESIEKLAIILESLGMEVDIASFGVFRAGDPELSKYGSQYPASEVITSSGRKIYVGGWNSPGYIVPEIFTGLEGRSRSGRGYAVRATDRNTGDQKRVVNARMAVNILAHELAQDFLTKRR